MVSNRRAPIGIVVALTLVALALPACGDDGGASGVAAGSGGAGEEATLVLDFVPGPVHAGIYRALDRGYYAEQGIDLEIIEPTSTADTLKLIDGGKADFGIADGIDVGIQIGKGRGAKAILALTQRPLGGLIALAESGYETPGELEGATIGVTGVPSDEAVVETVLSDGGADPSSVREVTIGFNGVQALENGKIDALTAYIPADGVQVELDGFPITSFPLDEHGGPSYPGLVVFSTATRIADDPGLMQGFVAATIHGYEDVVADPEVGLEALLAENPAIPREFAAASLAAYGPLFVAGADRFGGFAREDLRQLAAFMLDSGLAEERIAAARYATNAFVEGVR